jgi:hypothetical protein
VTYLFFLLIMSCVDGVKVLFIMFVCVPLIRALVIHKTVMHTVSVRPDLTVLLSHCCSHFLFLG